MSLLCVRQGLAKALLCTAMLVGLLTACGGGSDDPAPAQAPSTFAIGGTVSGLAGSGLQLSLNGSASLAVAASGAFVFSTQLAAGASYSVSVAQQPSGGVAQACTVLNASGTVTGPVTNVQINCPPPAPTGLAVAAGQKQLQFSWASTGATVSYQLQRQVAGGAWTDDGPAMPVATMNTAREVAVHRTDWATTRYRLSACNDGGCTPSADIGIANAMLNAIVYAKASNTGAQDRFGWAVSLSSDGQTLAVGAPDESSNATGIDGNQANEAAPSSGAVYVFVRSSTTWSQQAYIKASNAGANDAFGTAVSLSADGNWLAIGASNEASSASGVNGDQADNTAPGSGAVYVFYRQGSTWGQQAYLKASNTDSNDRFGETLSLSAQGNTLAIGARGESSGAAGVNGDQADNTSAFSGAAYVFVRDGAAWTQQAYIKPSNTGLNDQFGWQVSLSGDGATLAVGAWGEDSSATGIDGDQADNTSGQSGAVYVFVRQGSMWTQQAYIKASNAASNDQFGIAVSLSTDGNTLAVSADGEDSSAVGVGGDQTDNLGSASGAVYVFARQGSTWSQQAYIKASNAETSDRFSSQVSLSADGNTLAAGAVREGSVAVGINGTQVDNTAPFSGAVYLFARQGSTWSQRSFIKASNTNAGDTFGRGIDLSDDGSTLAVGAYSESSGASGINGDQADNSAPRSGAVYLY